MQVKKVTISLMIFILIFTSGWVMDTLIRKQQNRQMESPPSMQGYIIYSSHSSTNLIDHLTPYQPREYVRIIRLNTHNDKND